VDGVERGAVQVGGARAHGGSSLPSIRWERLFLRRAL
jgi:hypothetical protein